MLSAAHLVLLVFTGLFAALPLLMFINYGMAGLVQAARRSSGRGRR